MLSNSILGLGPPLNMIGPPLNMIGSPLKREREGKGERGGQAIYYHITSSSTVVFLLRHEAVKH